MSIIVIEITICRLMISVTELLRCPSGKEKKTSAPTPPRSYNDYYCCQSHRRSHCYNYYLGYWWWWWWWWWCHCCCCWCLRCCCCCCCCYCCCNYCCYSWCCDQCFRVLSVSRRMVNAGEGLSSWCFPSCVVVFACSGPQKEKKRKRQKRKKERKKATVGGRYLIALFFVFVASAAF